MDREHRLAKESIATLLFRMSAPATVALMVSALYNIVDSIFIGRGVGYMALGGLTIAFPVQMAIMALSQTVGIGVASTYSRSLGAGDREGANRAAGNSYGMVALLGLFICAGGLLFTDPILRLFGGTDLLMPYARDYLQVILLGSIYFPFVVSANNLIRAEGNPRMSMMVMILGAVTNMLLDYVFIFPLAMGIRGAALATILSQFLSLLLVLVYLNGSHTSIGVRLVHLRPDWQIQWEIIRVGSSSFARQVAGSLMAIAVNHSLAFYGGELALAAFGIVQRVIMFLFMPLFGTVQGMQPIVGYNYGAGRFDRVREVVKKAILVTTIFATVSTLIGQLFPEYIVGLFDDDPRLVETGVFALRVVIAMIPVVGVQIVGAALFQSLGKAFPALVLTLSRQVLFLIPLVLVLPRIGGLGLLGIWLAFPLSDFLSTLFTSIWVKREMSQLREQADPAASEPAESVNEREKRV